jgi:hypothetical protein
LFGINSEGEEAVLDFARWLDREFARERGVMLKQFLLILGIHESIVDEYIEYNWWVEAPATALGAALEKFVAAEQTHAAGPSKAGEKYRECPCCGSRLLVYDPKSASR